MPLKPPTKKIKIFGVVFIIAVLALQFTKYNWGEAQVELKGVPLNVLVAKNAYQQEKGLGGREGLAPYDGMLFRFEFPARYGFVMRDMTFPIDIVWLNAGEVVDIAPRVQPEPGVPNDQLRRYLPRAQANLVLELPAGWTEAKGLQIGDRLTVAK